jgi:hypothetical protein
MVPAQYVTMNALPLNSNGKIDRGTLQMPHQTQTYPLCDSEQEPITAEIVSMLQSLVGPELKVESTASFSFLGVNSLVFAQLRAMVARELGVDLTLPAMFRASNAKELAETVRSLAPNQEALAKSEGEITSFDFKHHVSPVRDTSVAELSADKQLMMSPFLDPKTG